MTTKLNFQAPVAGGSTVYDLAQLGGREGAPFFDSDGASLIELGHRCYNGEASQGTFNLGQVELATWVGPFPSAHCLLTMVEDSQTPDVWLSRGRIATDEGGRGVVRSEGELTWMVTVDDGNCDLRGQSFAEVWVRPEETDIQRLVALQLYTLNGSSSTATYHRDTCNITINTSHLAPNANTVSMPAKKYPAGTQPQDVIQDCADTAGKQYGVVIHHTGGSHLCLLYLVNDDHTTYLSAAKISDQLADWVPTSTTVPVLEPHWEQGAGQIIEMQTVLSGMMGIWGVSENATFVEYPGVADNTDYWVETYHDSFSTTTAQAAARVAGILEGRRNSHVTHRVSVLLNPDQVHLIGAGMSIAVKSAVTFDRGDPAGDPDAYVTRRIAECRFEPRIDGRYFAHLDLERPPLRVAPGRGKAGPIPPVQSEPPSGDALLLARLYPSNTTASASIDASWDADDRVAGLARVATTTADAGGGTTGSSAGETVPGNWLLLQLKHTLTGSVTFTGGYVRGQGFGKMRSGLGIGASLGQSQLVVRLMDSSNALKAVLLDAHEPASIDSQQWSNEGDGGANPPNRNQMYPADSQWDSALGAPMNDASGISGDYLLIEMGVRCFTFSGASGAGFAYMNEEPGDLPDNDQTQTTRENTWIEFWGASSPGIAGTPPPPAATDSTGSIGTSPIYAQADHQHPAQVAGVTPITDEDGYYTGEDVESALAEVGPRLLPDGGDDGQVLTKQSATDYDADWEDATGGSGGGTAAAFSGARAYNSAVQSITSGTPTAITLDTERYDTDLFHSTSSNTSRMTIPTGKAGKYLITGHLGFAANVTGYRDARLMLNGATILSIQRVVSSADTSVLSVSTVYDLVAGDYVELYAHQTSGGALNTSQGGNWSPELSVTLLAGSVGEFVGVSLTKSAVQSVATGTQTAITFDGEDFDTHSFHDNSSNTSRITIPTGRGGKYLVTASIEIDTLADAEFLILRIRKNGATVLDGRARSNSSGGDGSFPGPAYSKVIDLAAGDYIEVMAEHSHGSNRDIRSSANGTSFTATLLALNAPVSAGTAFPASPATDLRFWRTDLKMGFVYDGTRWLSETLYTDALVTAVVLPTSVTAATHRLATPLAGSMGVWVENFWNSFYVTGGTALGASHKWVCTFVYSPTSTTLATHNIDSGASDAYRNSGAIAVNAAVATTEFMFSVVATKTGTPGTLILTPRISYRLIGT